MPSGLSAAACSDRARPASGVRSAAARRVPGDVDGEQARVVGAEVVIPVAHRQRLVQDRGDPGVLARLPPLLVLGRVARQGLAGQQEGGRVLRRFHPRDAARQADDQARLAAVSGQPPQRRLLRALLAVGRVGVGPLGDEQQRAVGQEPRAALAVGRPGEPGGRAAGRVNPPDAGDVLLLVRAERLDRRRQPAAVGRQPQTGHPRDGHVVVQVMERGVRVRHHGTILLAAGLLAGVGDHDGADGGVGGLVDQGSCRR